MFANNLPLWASKKQLKQLRLRYRRKSNGYGLSGW